MTSLGRKLFGKFLGMTIATSSLLACGPTKSLQNATGTKDEAIIGGELVVRPEGAIVGGDVVQPLDPRTNHIASATVLVKNLGKTKNDTCTGTIVSKSVILTAAHCVSDHMRIYFGNSITAGSESRLVTVALENSIFAAKTKEMMRAESPEQWEQIRNHGDIALLKIEGEIPDSAQIAQLLTNKAHLKNGKEVILAGFGTYDAIKNLSDKRLRMAKVKIEDSHFAETEILLTSLMA